MNAVNLLYAAKVMNGSDLLQFLTAFYEDIVNYIMILSL